MIRFAREEDLDEIIAICKEHAYFEEAEYQSEGKKEKLKRAIFSDAPRLYCLVLDKDGDVGGYATYSLEFSTWDGDEYIHVDCWYLKKQYRNRGIGWKFAKKIGEEAIKHGKQVIQWQTPPFNEEAIKMYKAFGAVAKNKVRFYGDIDSWKKFLKV